MSIHTIIVSSEVRADSHLNELVTRTEPDLSSVLSLSTEPIVAKWEAIRDERGRKLLTLTLQDSGGDGEVKWVWTESGFKNGSFQTGLFSQLDSLLKKRIDSRIDQFQRTPIGVGD